MDTTTPSRPPRSRRQVIERSWVVGVVVFVIVRFVIAYSALARYDRFTVVVFGVLDVVTAVPYALGTARVVTGLVDRRARSAVRWGIVACVSFLAPYLWLGWAGREEFPALVYVLLGLLVVLLGANAVLGMARRVRVARRAGSVARGSA